MLARLDGVDGEVRVPVVGSRDQDRIDLGIAQDFLMPLRRAGLRTDELGGLLRTPA